jgi:Uncharacterized conserved protein (DUF2075)
MNRYYYADSISNFLTKSPAEILGALAAGSAGLHSSLLATQNDAWQTQVEILRGALQDKDGQGHVFFEYSIPRLGTRIDVVVILGAVIFVLEFKVGYETFGQAAVDQVYDYALDLKNFHESSHAPVVAPILLATGATSTPFHVERTSHDDNLLVPICVSGDQLSDVFEAVLTTVEGPSLNGDLWQGGRYAPTPTIIEAALALYGGHSVVDISRSDASATNLTETSESISNVIYSSRENSRKSICFVTGVPGAGKTLVGLNVATKHSDHNSALHSVFLSGNDPLVNILREALARDRVRREREKGLKVKKGIAVSEVKAFIQNNRHFRDECLRDFDRPPIEHVVLFDEAQRAWTLAQTASFMKRKRKQPDFKQSEPEFLISCLDRHKDWAVIVCLIGGGQEINTGEAGISEWIASLNRSFPDWDVYMSSKLQDSEYGAGSVLEAIRGRPNVQIVDHLHLGVSMRSFRAESVSRFVKEVLDLENERARTSLDEVRAKYPIALTRDLRKAKQWVRDKARGSERYGLIASSQAQRLKPHAIDVRTQIDPVHWFLNEKNDVRSSYYLEDVATEFQVQGLELDWACVTWDADLRYTKKGWQHRSFRGSKWIEIHKAEDQTYLKNAYRVLLTRARQGMVIFVPDGDEADPTRKSAYYDGTYEYLRGIGLQVL